MKQNKGDKTNPQGNSAGILTKGELALELRVSTRTIENMMKQKIIPYIRATKRSVRFYLPRILVALQKREVREAGRK